MLWPGCVKFGRQRRRPLAKSMLTQAEKQERVCARVRPCVCARGLSVSFQNEPLLNLGAHCQSVHLHEFDEEYPASSPATCSLRQRLEVGHRRSEVVKQTLEEGDGSGMAEISKNSGRKSMQQRTDGFRKDGTSDTRAQLPSLASTNKRKSGRSSSGHFCFVFELDARVWGNQRIRFSSTAVSRRQSPEY